MGCLADMDMQEKVMEVDYNYASPHYGSGSKCPAQPIWSPSALTVLRAIVFFDLIVFSLFAPLFPWECCRIMLLL